jgi:hydroxymethylglutaryl-CoA synthase
VQKVGIDTFAFYTSRYVLDLNELASARGTNPEKYFTGLGQRAMSVAPPGEDIVTMAANAASQALRGIDIDDIEMVLFATESGTDQSKAAGIYIHGLLNLAERCRVVELKQACYSATFGLQLVLAFLRENPQKKVLLIASDIARYGLNTPGESSQGCGAIAMVLAANPRILALDSEYGIVTENVMDFWRPNYLDEALVEGKYSSKLYLAMLEKTWRQYQALSNRSFTDHAYYCYHVPVPRLVEKAHHSLVKLSGCAHLPEEVWHKHIRDSLIYGRQIGNSYTAALYIGLASLLDFNKEDLAGKRIGLYSYGSGCVAEFFSGVIQAGYKDALHSAFHAQLIATRQPLNYSQYEQLYCYRYPTDGSDVTVPSYDTGLFNLAEIKAHKRIYQKVNAALPENLTHINKRHLPSEKLPSVGVI